MKYQRFHLMWFVVTVLLLTACTEDQLMVNAGANATETPTMNEGNQGNGNTAPTEDISTPGSDSTAPIATEPQDSELIIRLALDNDEGKQ